MRVFELHADDFVNNVTRLMIVDLDSIVSLQELRTESWHVTFSSGVQMQITKAAFDRLLVAWKSN